MIESVRSRQILFFGVLALVFKIAINFLQVLTMQKENTVVIRRGGSSATIHLFGATLISWKVDGYEALFVSKKSVFNNEKAIRGGVPIVFPQFGPWLLGPQHGFARISPWSVKGIHKSDSNSVTLVLEDTEKTRKMWDFNFRIEYTLTIVEEDQLKMDIIITNTGSSMFSFTFLLHNYFSVPDVLSCSIKGLHGCNFTDKVKNGEEFIEERDEVQLSEFTDRVYKNTTVLHTITNLAGGRTGKLEKFNLPDTVVWNPWSENAKGMSDFDDDEWQNMICVEAGYVSKPLILEPKTSFTASQILSIAS